MPQHGQMVDEEVFCLLGDDGFGGPDIIAFNMLPFKTKRLSASEALDSFGNTIRQTYPVFVKRRELAERAANTQLAHTDTNLGVRATERSSA